MASSSSRKQLHARVHMIIALVFLAFMVAVCWAEPPFVDYTFQLSHVDANRGFSSDELMHRAANRSRLRAATMYSTHAMASDPTPSSPDIKLRLCPDVLEYSVKFYVGSELSTAFMDTGSNLIWMSPRKWKIMDPKKLLPCSDNLCIHHANCRCENQNCKYGVQYGDKGRTVEGLLYKDHLGFLAASGLALKYIEVAFGRSTGQHFQGCSNQIVGILGMGRGLQSLPEQLNVKKFSYCLNTYSKPELMSTLLFKTVPDLTKGKRSGAIVVTTTLGRHRDRSWYFVNLEDISIGGTRLKIPALDLPDNDDDAAGNMFIDSGASFTFLEEAAFNKVVEKVNKTMEDKGYVKLPSDATDNICYSGTTNSDLPNMVLHFHNSADMELSWESYLWDSETSKCLAVKKGKKGSYRVLGNYQQQGLHMLFDIEKKELKFVQADCSKVA